MHVGYAIMNIGKPHVTQHLYFYHYITIGQEMQQTEGSISRMQRHFVTIYEYRLPRRFVLVEYHFKSLNRLKQILYTIAQYAT